MFAPATNFTLVRKSSDPLHRQVETWLRTQIDSGALPPGTSLPPRKELCEMLGGINYLTVRKAIATLTRDGMIFSVQGRGTFVADPKKKQLSVGLVLPSIDDEMTHALVDGIQEHFESLRPNLEPSVRTILFDSRKDAQKEIDNIAHLEDLPLDGAIIFPVSYGDILEHLARLKAGNFPLVLFANVPGITFNSVITDDYSGFYEVTKHLLEQGRRKLAWIGNRAGYYSDQPRLEGFRDAINDFGLPCERKRIWDLRMQSPTASFQDALVEGLTVLLEAPTLPDAIVCANDPLAIACVKDLERRGLQVPRDIAVTGFGDLKETSRNAPTITTVQASAREVGQNAAALLLEVINMPTTPARTITVPVSLQIRESS